MRRETYHKPKDGLVTFAQIEDGAKFFARVNQQAVMYIKQFNRGILVPNQDGVTNVMSDHPFSPTEVVGITRGAV